MTCSLQLIITVCVFSLIVHIITIYPHIFYINTIFIDSLLTTVIIQYLFISIVNQFVNSVNFGYFSKNQFTFINYFIVQITPKL